MHKKAWFLIGFVTGIFMRRWALSEGRGSARFTNCVAREGIFDRRAKTNLPMCLKRREALRLGRFAERVSTCLNLSAAEVPCKTAPFASFSGRTEKEGPTRPKRIPISSFLVKAIKRANVMQKFYEMVLVHFDETISLFRAERFIDKLRACMENAGSLWYNNLSKTSIEGSRAAPCG